MVLTVVSCLSLRLLMLAVPLSSAGNVAIGKPTNQTSAWNGMTSDHAVDGVLYDGTSNHCASPEIPIGRPAAWWVNLERLHVVKSVTVYNTGDIQDYKRLNNFTVVVTNPRQHPVMCGRYVGMVGPGAHVTLTCPHNTVGNRVQFSREGTSPYPYYLTLCEVEVNAHLYEGCRLGFYGRICGIRCGQCANSQEEYNPCDKRTGRCINGCQVGWTGRTCHSKLAYVNKRSVVVPWLLFSISCMVLIVLGGTMLYSRRYNRHLTCTSQHRNLRSVSDSNQRMNNTQSDFNLELEPALSRDTQDGLQYTRLREEFDENTTGVPYGAVL